MENKENKNENFEKNIENKNGILLKIDNFEGPLELLLYLIEKKKLKISEVKISQLIDEYLAVIERSKKDNLEIKVEFLLTATELLEIKAMSVLHIDDELETEVETFAETAVTGLKTVGKTAVTNAESVVKTDIDVMAESIESGLQNDDIRQIYYRRRLTVEIWSILPGLSCLTR